MSIHKFRWHIMRPLETFSSSMTNENKRGKRQFLHQTTIAFKEAIIAPIIITLKGGVVIESSIQEISLLTAG